MNQEPLAPKQTLVRVFPWVAFGQSLPPQRVSFIFRGTKQRRTFHIYWDSGGAVAYLAEEEQTPNLRHQNRVNAKDYTANSYVLEMMFPVLFLDTNIICFFETT